MQRFAHAEAIAHHPDIIPTRTLSPAHGKKRSALEWLPLSLHLQGAREEAETTAWAGLKTAQARQDWTVSVQILSHLSAMALAQGDFDAVERYAQDALGMSMEAASPWHAQGALHAWIGAMALRGKWGDAQQALVRSRQPGGILSAPLIVRLYQQVLLAYQPHPLEENVKQLGDALLKVATSEPEWLAPLATLIELGDASLQADVTDTPAQYLRKSLQNGIVLSSGWVFLVPRQLGVSAMLHGDWERAESYFQQAIDVATASGAQPELGRTYQVYARMLLLRQQRGDGRRIATLLEEALRLFETLEMTPFIPETQQLQRVAPRA